jgi:hypothetical protein
VATRLGVGYHNVSTSDVGSGSVSIIQFALEAEPPWNHFGFQVGPTADIPLSGSQTVSTTLGGLTTSAKVDSSMLQLGLSAGMLGHFWWPRR